MSISCKLGYIWNRNFPDLTAHELNTISMCKNKNEKSKVKNLNNSTFKCRFQTYSLFQTLCCLRDINAPLKSKNFSPERQSYQRLGFFLWFLLYFFFLLWKVLRNWNWFLVRKKNCIFLGYLVSRRWTSN